MSSQPGPAPRATGAALLELYDDALPQVYGYLVGRCGDRHLAEDLTAETFLAAVGAVRGEPGGPRDAAEPTAGSPPAGLTVGWLIGVARHKLADHWRRAAREERRLEAVAGGGPTRGDPPEDPWDAELDALHARAVLAELAPVHRLVLTLRYVDDLPVPEVAAVVGRSLHATEALLVRARTAFRRRYLEGSGGEPPDE